MQTAKQEAETMIKALPDDATFEDMQYKLYVLEKMRKAKESVEKHGMIPQEEVEKRLRKRLIG